MDKMATPVRDRSEQAEHVDASSDLDIDCTGLAYKRTLLWWVRTATSHRDQDPGQIRGILVEGDFSRRGGKVPLWLQRRRLVLPAAAQWSELP